MIHYTSIEQSKHLLDLGMSPASADMKWRNGKVDNLIHYAVPFPLEEFELCNLEKDAPCWSLGALLDIMPKTITDEYDSTGCLGMCVFHNSSWGWVVYYSNADADCSSIHEEQGKTLLKAAYNMVCWLLEQGYIKNEV